MSFSNRLTEERAVQIMLVPNNFRKYTGERVRGVLAHNAHRKWYLLEQPQEGWKSNMLTAEFIVTRGKEIELQSFQIDKDPFKKEHFYDITASPIDNRYVFKKMIILGAGASFDCLSNKDVLLPKIPLSNDLFKSDPFNLISDYYPAVANKFSTMAKTKNLEEYFTRRWRRLEEKSRPEELAELMNTQFYLHHLFLTFSNKYFGNINCNYKALVEQINDYCSNSNEKVAVVSYNYDTIFEQALESRYRRIDSIGDYIANDIRPVSLLKPHGSCDWVRPIKTEYNSFIHSTYANRRDNDIRITTLAQGLYKGQISLADIHEITNEELLLIHKIEQGKSKYFQRSLEPKDYKVERFYWPNMLLPYNEKDEFVMPNFHTYHLDEVLRQVEHIEIIGWKSEEQTMMNKFKTLIGDRFVTVTIIDKLSNEDPEKNSIVENLRLYLKNAEFRVKNIGFSGYMDQLVDNPDLFLN